jgi:hypothetical protein
MNSLSAKIPSKYWAYVALGIWGALCFLLLHKTYYGMDEGAAHALLLVWSVSDNVVSPIVTLGFPDFRTIFFVPAGILWTGNLLAAKITTMVVVAVAAWAIHAWRSRSGESEAALIGTGLLLISPLIVSQIDSMTVSAYLLFAFGLGAWSDHLYRESKRAFGGMYFAQIFLCLVSITLHPVGLAYPLSLIWTWYKNPVDRAHRNYFLFGISFAVVMALALTSGWNNIEWFGNPIKSLSSLVLGPADGDAFGAFHWFIGVVMLLVLILVVWKQSRALWADFLGRILLSGLLISAVVGDDIFAVLSLVICLYWGFPLLLRKSAVSNSSFWGQRGIVLFLSVLISTSFMMVDKATYQMLPVTTLSPRDAIIKAFAEDSGLFSSEEAEQKASSRKRLLVRSQWPSLTMLACRCDALPLPPYAQNSDALLAMLKGTDYLIFDPRNPANSSLSHNLATMDAGKVETIALQIGGVIIQIKNASPAIAPVNKS